MPNLARIRLLNDGSLHRLSLALNPDNTLSNESTVDGAAIAGSWDPALWKLTFARLFADGGARRYDGYYMEFSAEGSPALAGEAADILDDGSVDSIVGWYAAEDLPHVRLEPPSQTNPPSLPGLFNSIPPDGRWEIVDGGTIGTLFISQAPQGGSLSSNSTLNSAQITGKWDPGLSELSFQQSFGEGLVNIYDGFLALTAEDGSLVLAGTVEYHDREYGDLVGWVAG